MMRSNKRLIAILVVVAVVLIGIGFAAITSIDLNITGKGQGKPNDANFKVRFVQPQTPKVTSNVEGATVEGTVTGERTATMSIGGLTAKGDTASVEFTVENASDDLSAKLEAKLENTNAEYFKTSYKVGKDTIKKGEETTIEVTVELMKTPIKDEVTGKIEASLIAMPENPGEETGTGAALTGEGTGKDMRLVSQITSENYGDLVNYSVEVNGEVLSDWRIFYNDGNNVYMIYESLLPNKCIDTEKLGMVRYDDWMGCMVAFDETKLSGPNLGECAVDILRNRDNWSQLLTPELAKTDSFAMGSPTLGLLLDLYNELNEEKIIYTEEGKRRIYFKL